jgi:antitoxin ParD1/3/4
VPTRKIVLIQKQEEFIESVIRAGEYQTADEVIRAALDALQQHRRQDAAKGEGLRTLIRDGAKALEAGDFTEIDDADLERLLTALAGTLRTRGT